MVYTERLGHDPTLHAIGDVAATMNGGARLSEESDILQPYTPDYTDMSTQRAFLGRALREAQGIEYEPRTIRGPHHAAFNALAKEIDDRLRGIDPTLTPDYLAPAGYRSREVDDYFSDNSVQKRLLDNLREKRVWQLRDLGRKLSEEGRTQELPAGLLDAPPYHKQGETVSIDTASKLCVNACFRMIHHGLAGWAPDEDILTSAVVVQHGDLVVDDGEYFKLLQTDAFKEVCDRTIKVVEVLGADFATIAKLTSGVKAKYADAKVYAIVSLGTENAKDKSIWHTNILRYTEDGDVITRDPATFSGSPKRTMYGRNFFERWAVAYNRVQMVIAI